MAEKYQNKYLIQSARAGWWDYGWAGSYFITICTKNREHYFGEIKNQKMNLFPIGKTINFLIPISVFEMRVANLWKVGNPIINCTR